MSAAELPADVVIPTVVRPSLRGLLESLAHAGPPWPASIVVVDDRADGHDLNLREILGPPSGPPGPRLQILHSGGRGPAAARNLGWRAGRSRWVVFLDDDVEVEADWTRRLADDLAACGPRDAGSQGRIVVPLPAQRRPTDWERNVAGLESARWATADLAYRRAVLRSVGGFDERFRRAYREDADLGLRITAAGWRIRRGRRQVRHPVRPAGPLVSLRMQAGNAEDPFMRARHGPGWRRRAGVPRGRRPWHLATVAVALAGLLARVGGRRRLARAAGLGWCALTLDFTARRLVHGPWSVRELGRMTVTSPLLPFAAVRHYLRGVVSLPRRLARPGPVPGRPAAVLFDRDGTLVRDAGPGAPPDAVVPVPGVAEALGVLRDHGVLVGVVSNQGAVARGHVTVEQVEAVNQHIDRLLGPFDVWCYCPHAPSAGCGCRKPAPGLVVRAAEQLGVDPRDCVVVGDIGADVGAAAAAGARGILVPDGRTRAQEVRAAPEVAADLLEAVTLALGTRGDGRRAVAA